MNIIRRTFGLGKLVELPPVEQPVFLDRRTAYTCLVETCRNIQQDAPMGVCRKCGSSFIVSVDHLLKYTQSLVHQRIVARRRKPSQPTPETVEENRALYFTHFEK